MMQDPLLKESHTIRTILSQLVHPLSNDRQNHSKVGTMNSTCAIYCMYA
jgi:hypothetical protein